VTNRNFASYQLGHSPVHLKHSLVLLTTKFFPEF
jgi:hypothetical protein